MNYLDRISKSKEDKEKEELADTAEQAKIQTSADIQALVSAERSQTREVNRTMEAIPFSLDNYLTQTRTLRNIQEDLADARKAQSELFTD